MSDALSGPVDLDAYFARIGYDGPRDPTLKTLKAIHALQPSAITFENLDVLLGRGVSLEADDVWRKLVVRGRGGYCYEQNGLLKRVLTAMGYEVEGLIARVRWQAPAGAPDRPRSHMALRVWLDGKPWLADVGFGGCVMTAPIRLEPNIAQPTPHGAFRMLPEGDELLVQADLAGEWTPLYLLNLQAQNDVDYQLANWFTSTHPSSRFVQHLSVARTTPKARYALLDNRLTIRHTDGRVERHELAPDEIAEALRVVFRLPVEAEWASVVTRVALAEPA